MITTGHAHSTDYLWQFWQELRGNSSLLSTAQMVPVVFSGAIAALATGLLISRIQPGYILLIAMLAFCMGNVIASVTPVGLTYWGASFIACLITPIGMDSSWPSGSIILSDFLPRNHQGLAGSLMNTVVNYSISIGLGVAGLVESRINRDGSRVLEGYRSAHYVGIGLAGLGVGISCLLISSTRRESRSRV